MQSWEREGFGKLRTSSMSGQRGNSTDIWVAPYVAMQGETPILGVFAFDLAAGTLRTVDVEEAGTLDLQHDGQSRAAK